MSERVGLDGLLRVPGGEGAFRGRGRVGDLRGHHDLGRSLVAERGEHRDQRTRGEPDQNARDDHNDLSTEHPKVVMDVQSSPAWSSAIGGIVFRDYRFL